jgi:hypothetical protein
LTPTRAIASLWRFRLPLRIIGRRTSHHKKNQGNIKDNFYQWLHVNHKTKIQRIRNVVILAKIFYHEYFWYDRQVFSSDEQGIFPTPERSDLLESAFH